MEANFHGIKWHFDVVPEQDSKPTWRDVVVEFGRVDMPTQYRMISDYHKSYQDQIKKFCFESSRQKDSEQTESKFEVTK